MLGGFFGGPLACFLARKLGTEAAERLLRTHLNVYPDRSNRCLTGPIFFVSRPLPFVSFALAPGVLFPGPLLMARVGFGGIQERSTRARGSREGRSPVGAEATRTARGKGR